MPATVPRRAIGIVRVSEVKGREGDSFASPPEQRERIRAACERDGLALLDVFEELDVKGGTPLDRRLGLSRAIEAVEAGHAEVVVVAYFDRLVRSLQVQAQILSRVEEAGGQVLAVDVGEVSTKTAAKWLSSTMLGMVAEYTARMGAERSAGAQAAAVARGVIPFPNVPPGLRVGEDGRAQPVPEEVPFVNEALRLRAEGATIDDARAYLAANGIERSYHGVQALLSSRLLLGEIHFGKLVNLHAHDRIVDPEVWRRAQRTTVARGRRAKSERLLARLGVLRCATCNARMVVGSANHGDYPLYRCPPNGDCPRRVTISAELVEGIVVDEVRRLLDDVEGAASAATEVRSAEESLACAQRDLDAAFRAFSGFEDETAARERLSELREARDREQERVESLASARTAITVTVAADWNELMLDERRSLIRATIARITIAPGRGAGRVTVEPLGQ